VIRGLSDLEGEIRRRDAGGRALPLDELHEALVADRETREVHLKEERVSRAATGEEGDRPAGDP